MKKSILVFPAFYLFLFLSAAFAELYNPVQDFRRQIEIFSDEIQNIENILSENNIAIDKLNKELKNIANQLKQTSELIKSSDTKNLGSDEKLNLLESELLNQIDKLEKLKNSFKNKVIWLYKNGSQYPLQILFTADNFSQFYTRLRYLQRISQMRIKDLENIKMESYILEEKKKLSGMKESERQKYFAEKKENEKELLSLKSVIQKSLDSLLWVNDVLNRKISVLKNNLAALDTLSVYISGNLSFPLYNYPVYKDSTITELKGRLIMPVASNFVLIDFGKSVNPFSKTLTYNNGMDFLVASGSEVFAIHEGTVYQVLELPELGNTIIIKHNDDYYSMYSVLQKIDIKQGDTIKSGQVIAKTYYNNNGQCFHFELWEKLKPVDPKLWLKFN